MEKSVHPGTTPDQPVPAAPSDVCAIHCTICEGQDHHWDYFGDEVDGEPVCSCKHCEAIKPIGIDDV